MREKKDHKLYLVLLIERGSSEIASTPFLKASPPVSCIPVPSTSCRQQGFFLGWGGGCCRRTSCFTNPFLSVLLNHQLSLCSRNDGQQRETGAGWKLNPFLPPRPGQDFLVRITHNFSKPKIDSIRQHILEGVRCQVRTNTFYFIHFTNTFGATKYLQMLCHFIQHFNT